MADDPELLSLLSLVKASRYPEIEHLARRMLAREQNPFVLKALSFALIGQERFEEALPVLATLRQATPADAEIQTNSGIAMAALLRWDEAVASYQRALKLDPASLQAYSGLGIVYSRMHRWGDAVPPLLKAIELAPDDNVGAIEVLADCLLNAGRVDEAWTCYQELFRNDSSNLHTLYQLIWSSLQRCEWDDLERKLRDLRERTDNYSVDLDTPFEALSYPGLSAADHLGVARPYALRYVGVQREAHGKALFSSAGRLGRRLKVGYLSADFRSHPVGLVLPEVIERHNRSHVEIHGYSTGADDRSVARSRLVSAFEHFSDIANDSPQQMISRIRADEIDILVDLNGWTTGNRPEVLVARCAPIQVNWLGYPGTMGHPRYADYIIGDTLVTPAAHAAYFSELIAQLPHCYLPADTTRSIAAPPSRSDVALPEATFVFCSFNNRYKLNPGLFDAWCDILRQASDSILWLADPGDGAATRLREEAGRRRIDPGRLIFAARVEDPLDHLARIQLADVALDTFPYNSHSSGIDALWAGVPMITCLGETFASRVGASLVTACELPDLVTKSTEDYVALAVSMYRDRCLLASVRSQLARRQCPLFDMPSFVAALEAMFDRMWAQHLAGVKAPIYR
ncbi:MAG: hypothetical protein A3H93_18820 [Rhodocyclales bacterium RIFCSPLOWO2_02_FULL_63_24]|nr:MAG: hypothetical protein A3H93_18820 [Rhodocyclales bacterium RIFCSPLOWO2_02_FULL_63_24]